MQKRGSPLDDVPAIVASFDEYSRFAEIEAAVWAPLNARMNTMPSEPTIEIAPPVKLSGCLTWHRLLDGTETCDPCAPIIALRVYESDCDSSSFSDNEGLMRKLAIVVLRNYFECELDRPKIATGGPTTEGPFVLVNGRGLFLSAANIWTAGLSGIESRSVRLFRHRAVAEKAANELPCRPITIVQLDRAYPES